MKLEGQRVKRTRWVPGGDYVVEVQVDAVIPPDDPSEPCYEAETVQWLREVQEHARVGDLPWLRRIGKVYKLVPTEA